MADKVYTLKSVGDFLAVPEDRRRVCIEQFGMWLTLIEGLRGVFAGVQGINAATDEFRWTDDGKDDANVAINLVPDHAEGAS